MDKYVKTNQQMWDQRAGVHVKSEFYDVAGFKAGKSSLNPIEMDEIAGEVAGKGPAPPAVPLRHGYPQPGPPGC